MNLKVSYEASLCVAEFKLISMSTFVGKFISAVEEWISWWEKDIVDFTCTKTTFS